MNNYKILELFKLSAGNKIYNLDYNIIKKESLNKILEISYYKKFIKENIGKMLYKNNGNNKKKIYLIKYLFLEIRKELK